jgi:hypothetical protein
MDAERADQIKRAMQAVEQAPQTETGLIIPPHVAEQRRQEEADPTVKPNRAQRRRQAKLQRREAKRLERVPADVQEVMAEAKEAAAQLSETELLAAEAMVRDVAQSPELFRARLEEGLR